MGKTKRMKKSCVIVLIIVVATLFTLSYVESTTQPEDNLEGVVELTNENIEEFIKSNNVLVEFYAPWCSHCKNFAPIYQELGMLVSNSKRATDVKIAKVDASKYSDLVPKFKIQGFPSLKLFMKSEEFVNFQGMRSVEQIL